ncbi:Glutamyl-tRNA(Gln) amidotransferase subunit B, mitochondrial [Halotydeus destructor]|nr:Glutamyl-tRNA(Gln) amidotransferase subunit B, mitochondrial [Halotydeus destructor]
MLLLLLPPTSRLSSSLPALLRRRAHQWRPAVGLEVHAQLQVASKLFSRAPAGDGGVVGGGVNGSVAPLDAAHPGSLPVLSGAALRAALTTALALNCSRVAGRSSFERKHYFYADMPLGYQITQQRRLRLRQVQLEQDSGKCLHHYPTAGDRGEDSAAATLVDLNRAGVALVELVFEADLDRAEEPEQRALGGPGRGLRDRAPGGPAGRRDPGGRLHAGLDRQPLGAHALQGPARLPLPAGAQSARRFGWTQRRWPPSPPPCPPRCRSGSGTASAAAHPSLSLAQVAALVEASAADSGMLQLFTETMELLPGDRLATTVFRLLVDHVFPSVGAKRGRSQLRPAASAAAFVAQSAELLHEGLITWNHVDLALLETDSKEMRHLVAEQGWRRQTDAAAIEQACRAALGRMPGKSKAYRKKGSPFALEQLLLFIRTHSKGDIDDQDAKAVLDRLLCPPPTATTYHHHREPRRGGSAETRLVAGLVQSIQFPLQAGHVAVLVRVLTLQEEDEDGGAQDYHHAHDKQPSEVSGKQGRHLV